MITNGKQFSNSYATAWLRLRTVFGAMPLLLLLALPGVVQAQDFTYTTNIGAITITGYTGSSGAVTIPDTIDGLPVTSIGSSAFSSCTNLTSVTIPNSVTSIEWNAFSECTSLTSVTIPNSVTNIGSAAFVYCTRLEAITVDALNSTYSSVDGVLFNQSQTRLIQCPGGKSGSYTIPTSVSSIGYYAFTGCSSLASVTIPNSVTSIGNYAFYGFSSLTCVTIGNSVTNIGSFAFFGCSSLTRVTIPNSVTSIEWNAFRYCTSLTGVYFKGNAPSIGSSVFAGANHATVYYLAGTTGWDSRFSDGTTALWKPQVQTGDASLGVRTNQFGFTINWTSGQVVVVEACTNLANLTWSPLQTNTLSGDSFYSSDPQWTNYPTRYYRLRSP